MTRTSIEWCRNQDGSQGFTVNPIRFRNKETGKIGHYCEKLSPGCKNCYASRMQKGPYLSGLEFIAENKDRGELFFDENVLQQVLRRRKPSTFFWCDCTDMFGPWVPDADILSVLQTIGKCPRHRFLILTKRARRMREFLTARRWRNLGHSPAMGGNHYVSLIPGDHRDGRSYVTDSDYLPNLGLGVSAEDQEQADERIPDLRQTPAAMRFVSMEPMLGPISCRWAKWEPLKIGFNGQFDGLRGIDWVIVGGESGPGARPMHPGWLRSVRDQCQAAGVPFFFKQWGEHAPYPYKSDPGGIRMERVGKKAAGRILDGRTWDEMPEMLK